jgi:hypothetical protein
MRRFWIAICLAVLSASWPALLSAQPLECTGKAAQAQLSAINPVYVDAMELARQLIDHEFILRCVQASKMQNVFDGQRGAALYVTDEGSFDVLFLTKEQSFSSVQVVEQNEGKRHMYSSRGTPPSRFHSDGNKKTYFITFGNLLFVAWSDAELAATIQNKIPGAHALSTAP